MLAFHPPEAADRLWVQPLLDAEGIPLCDYSFAALFCWQEHFHHQFCRIGDRLLIRLESSLGTGYLWPVGRGDPLPAFQAMAQDARAQQRPLRLLCVPTEQKQWLEARWPCCFTFTETRDAYDYFYETDRLATLSGKKLHAKRNHIHRLDENCPGWEFRPLTEADLPLCRDFDARWYERALARPQSSGAEALDEERRALELALTHYSALGLDGGALWHGERMLGFCLGSRITPDVYDVHFERADEGCQGAYPALAREMARAVQRRYPDALFLNREDDMGFPGLRQAKLSYHPHHMGENFSAYEVCDAFPGGAFA